MKNVTLKKRIVSIAMALLMVATCVFGDVSFTAKAANTYNAGTMSSHSNGSTATGLYFTMDANDAPYNSAWTLEYTQTSVDGIKVIRDGVTRSIGIVDRPLIVKYSATEYFLKIEAWTLGDNASFQDEDIIVVEGDFYNAANDATINIETSYILYKDGSYTFFDSPILAGTMKQHSNTSLLSTGFYFTLDTNSAPSSAYYSPITTNAVKLIRDGVTYNVGLMERELLLKENDSQYFFRGESWPLGDYAPLKTGDMIIIDGFFSNKSNGTYIKIDKTYAYCQSDGTVKISQVWPLTVELGNMQAHPTNTAPSVGESASGDFHFTLADSEYVPVSDAGYYPMAANTIQRIRNGATTDATNLAAPTFVKYSATEWRVPGWTIGTQHNQDYTWQDGDILLIEGNFNSAQDGSGVTFHISKTYVYYKDGVLTFSTTMPDVEDAVIEAGCMKANSSQLEPNDSGSVYFTMENNAVPYTSGDVRYKPTSAENVKLIRNGSTTTIGHIDREMLTNYGDNQWILEGWTLVDLKPWTEGDVLVVEGTFSNADNNVTFSVDRTYILYKNGKFTFTSNMPVFVGSIQANPNQSSPNSDGSVYFMMENNTAPYSSGDIRYKPTSSDAVKLIRNGSTTTIGHVGREMFTNYGDNQWILEGWTLVDLKPWTEGDILLIDGVFRNEGNNTTIVVNPTYILYYGGVLTFSTTMPEIPEEIVVGPMQEHTNGYNENGIYFALESTTEIPYDTDWTTLFKPVNTGTILRIRDGEVKDVTNTGGDTIVKYGDTDWFLQGWAIQYSDMQDGDILKIEGQFKNETNGVTFTMETSYIVYSGGKMLFYDILPKTVNADNIVAEVTDNGKINVNMNISISYSDLDTTDEVAAFLNGAKLNGVTLQSLVDAGSISVYFEENAGNTLYPTTMTVEIASDYYKTISDFAISFESMDYTNGTVNYTGGSDIVARWIEVDGKAGLTTTDLIHLLRDVSGDAYQISADINCDGQNDRTDSFWIRRMLLGETVEEIDGILKEGISSDAGAELTIGVWNGSYHAFGKKDLNILDAAGINLLIGVDEQWTGGMSGVLDKASAVGIDVIADFRNWDSSTIPEWSSHDALRGFLMWDEPCATNVSDLKSLQSSFNNTTLASKEFYLNLLPQAASNKSLYNPTFGDFWGGLVGYDYDEDYLYEFTDGLSLQTLAFDSYGLLDNNTYIRPTYYSTFEILANTAKEKDIPLQYSLCSAGHNSTDAVYTTPTATELRWQMALGLTFGAKELVHYTYTSDASDYTTMVEYGTWETTELYDAVKEVNQEYLAWDDIYLNYTWQATMKYEVGTTNTALSKMTGATYTGTAMIGFEYTENMMTGWFKDAAGNEAFMITNAGQVGSVLSSNENKASFTMTAGEVTITFAEGYERAAVIREGNTIVYLLEDDNTVTLPVDAYEGIFVIPLD